MGWVRPENVSYPKVWTTFLAKDLDSDNLVEYRVQDLPEDRFEDTVKYLLENYLNDEPFTSSKDLQDDPEALEEQKNFWRNHFKSKTTLVCFKEGSDEIVGVNLTAIVLEEDKDKPIEVKIQIYKYGIESLKIIFFRLKRKKFKNSSELLYSLDLKWTYIKNIKLINI